MVTQPDSLGTRLRERRKQMRYSQKELAELVGKKQTALYQWENGRTQPSLQNIEHLARILETTPAWLAFGSEFEAA